MITTITKERKEVEKMPREHEGFYKLLQNRFVALWYKPRNQSIHYIPTMLTTFRNSQRFLCRRILVRNLAFTTSNLVHSRRVLP